MKKQIISIFLIFLLVDNSSRFMHINDHYTSGMNGVAAFIHTDQKKNIFSTVGMNLEGTHTYPPAGKTHNLPQAARHANMTIEQIDSLAVRMTQKASDAAGLNFDILFELGNSHLDQTITIWPDHDVDSSSCFWASYMNQVQNTSLFMRTPIDKAGKQEWLELASAGHSASDGIGVFGRKFNPYGLTWSDHLIDNPLLRQAIKESPQTRKATNDAGFKPYPSKKIDHFYYGFIDEYVYLMIFREPEFIMWMSASGSMAVRSPAWDYEIKAGPQKAGEKRTYHVRLVYYPFKGIEDVLKKVKKFRTGKILK